MRGVKQLIGVLGPRVDTTNRRHNLLIHSKHIKMREHVEVPLFLDFEDWRRGIRGWEQSCRVGDTDLCLPSYTIDDAYHKPPGAHWSPFDFDTLGPSVPTFGKTWNMDWSSTRS